MSFVSRFEKLDITPKSAQKLKPVLERWLVEAELWNQKGQQNLMEFVGGEALQEAQAENQLHNRRLSRSSTLTFEKNSLPLAKRLQRSPRAELRPRGGSGLVL